MIDAKCMAQYRALIIGATDHCEANQTVPAFTPHGRWSEEIQIRPPLGVRFRCAGVLTVCGRIVHFFCAAAAALRMVQIIGVSQLRTAQGSWTWMAAV